MKTRTLLCFGLILLLALEVAVEGGTPVVRDMDFDSWPAEGTNAGCHTYLDWVVCTGVVNSVSAASGKAAHIFISDNFTNTMQSPLFTNGFGKVSFSCRTGTSSLYSINFSVEYSTNGNEWIELDRVTNFFSTVYSNYEHYQSFPFAAFLRIHPSLGLGTNTSVSFIDEHFDGGTNVPSGWEFVGINTYSSSAGSGLEPPGLKFDRSTDQVTTSGFSSQNNISFWLKGQSANSANSFLVEGSNATGWVTITNIIPIANSETNYSINISSNITRARFSYSKVFGNVAFDDFVTRGNTVIQGPMPQEMILDNITVDEPEDLRYQNFDEWTDAPGYGESTLQGWLLARSALVSDLYSYSNLSVRLRNINDQQPYIQTPVYYDGIGRFRFQYRHWDNPVATGSQVITALIQSSSNQVTWVTHDTLSISNGVYQLYENNLNLTNGAYSLRIYITNGNERALFDEIEALWPASFSLSSPVLYNVSISNATIIAQSINNSNNWSVLPEYTADLVSDPVVWSQVSSNGASFSGGTNLIWFTVPTNSPSLYYRIRYSSP